MSTRIQSSLPQRDDCKTRKDTKYSIAKQRPTTTPPPQTIGKIINNEPPHKDGQQPKPHGEVGGGRGAQLYLSGQSFALDSAVVETQQLLAIMFVAFAAQIEVK